MVSSTRHYLDLCLRLSTGVYTRWNNLVPIKLNILNLRDKGVDIVFVLCPVCLEVGGVFKSFVYCFPASFPSLESHCKVLGD